MMQASHWAAAPKPRKTLSADNERSFVLPAWPTRFSFMRLLLSLAALLLAHHNLLQDMLG
jgi:hypothetical protein